MSADRAFNLYLFALLENANEETRERIEQALEPPATFKVNGAPAWYGDDDDAWQAFEYAMKRS